ncbi:regulatory protein, FmdB family [Candidatus Omnitrophus magneticus]|uniref:Regulatory protein, FmdB family n=1 Tax=Candidatus Omnitrophus magneticus TaxID=1609969 RepID=A0A0F0CQG7_9BACT|nr:regulatory protein, FmdB family [Candidatus Omnitrophus magneticus]
MPTYVYKCKECDYSFERFQSIKDEPIDKCPKCNLAVERVITTGAGLIFKGSGFYETDYKNVSSDKSKAPCGKNEKTAACTSCPSSK